MSRLHAHDHASRRRHGRRPKWRPPIANTAFVVDVSGSMRLPFTGSASGVELTRLAVTIECMLVQIRYKAIHTPNDLVGCVAFGSDATVALPLTSPGSPWIEQHLAGLQISGLTNMVAGVTLGLDMLCARPGRILRNMVLISDGYPDDRAGLGPLVQRAYAERVNIHTVGVGDEGGYDAELLRWISANTHKGRYQSVQDVQQYAHALQAVA
jgi:Mg-chelatase subunit ChlD